jgi:hypothetical protein
MATTEIQINRDNKEQIQENGVLDNSDDKKTGWGDSIKQ